MVRRPPTRPKESADRRPPPAHGATTPSPTTRPPRRARAAACCAEPIPPLRPPPHPHLARAPAPTTPPAPPARNAPPPLPTPTSARARHARQSANCAPVSAEALRACSWHPKAEKCAKYLGRIVIFGKKRKRRKIPRISTLTMKPTGPKLSLIRVRVSVGFGDGGSGDRVLKSCDILDYPRNW